jgi:CDP-glycerol glycerophosphotransferase (TagB/SpsB family)
LNFGNFAAMFQDMLTFATANPTVDVLLRPHPLMFRTLVDREVIPTAVLDLWLEQWNALANTAIDADDDVALLFGAADLMVTDGISFLGEYPLATNKPGIFFENSSHWVLSELGELAASANIRVSNFVEFVAAFRDVQINGLPDFSKQISALRTVAQPYPGDAAKLLVDLVKNDYLAETPLVDKSLVTEIAWENQPGTEAAWD